MNRFAVILTIWCASVWPIDAKSQVLFHVNKRYQTFFLKQKDVKSDYLFYSHKAGTFESLFFMDRSKKLALSADRKYFVVLDRSNLQQDTILLSPTLHLEMAPVATEHGFYFIGLDQTSELKTDGGYQVQTLPRVKKAQLAIPFVQGVIAPDTKGMQKQDGFPAFQFFTGKKRDPLTRSLPFIQEKDFSKIVPSVYNTTFGYYQTQEELIIFPVYTQQLIRINLKTEKVAYTKLPYEPGEQISYFFHDHVFRQSYVLKHFFNSNFMELYSIDIGDKTLKFIKAIPYFPEAIVNNSLYCRELDAGNKVNHFLIPIGSL